MDGTSSPRGSVFKATPLVHTGADSPAKRLLAKRNSEGSAGSMGTPSRVSGLRRTSYDFDAKSEVSDGTMDEELRSKLEKIAHGWKNKTESKGDAETPATLRKKTNVYSMTDVNMIVSRYTKLEAEAISKQLGVVQMYAKNATEQDIRRFICSVF